MSRTPPHILEYSAAASPTPWRQLIRFFIMGPCTGAAVGFAQNTAVLLCWLFHGEPDFFYRGWSGVKLDYVILSIGGGMVGVAYGLALWAFERLTGRRIRSNLAIPLTILLAFVEAGLFAELEFRRGTIEFALLPQCAAIATGSALSVIASRAGER